MENRLLTADPLLKWLARPMPNEIEGHLVNLLNIHNSQKTTPKRRKSVSLMSSFLYPDFASVPVQVTVRGVKPSGQTLIPASPLNQPHITAEQLNASLH